MAKIVFKAHSNGKAIDWKVGTKSAHEHKTKVKGGDGAEALNFYLSDSTVAAGYRFDTNNPIWVCEGESSCPSTPSHNDQIVVIDKTDRWVSAVDRNTRPVTLRYQLNVRDSNGTSVPIDPIIQNLEPS